MFTRNAHRTLAVAAMVAAAVLSGCESHLDPKEYGEIITEVPERLDQPFPLPQLEEPQDEKPQDKAKEVAN